MPSERSIVLAQRRLQLAAVLAARVALGPVDSAPVPGQPASWIGIDVLAVAQVEQLVLERELRIRVRAGPADLAPENDRHRHPQKIAPGAFVIGCT
jgi:hypothetical protein